MKILTLSLCLILSSLALAADNTASSTTYCEENSSTSWKNCIEGEADANGNLTEVHDVVINGVSLGNLEGKMISEPYNFVVTNNVLTIQPQNIVLGTLTGKASSLSNIRYDQELKLADDISIDQSSSEGDLHSYCSKNDWGFYNKSIVQDVLISTKLTVGSWSNTTVKKDSVVKSSRPALSCP